MFEILKDLFGKATEVKTDETKVETKVETVEAEVKEVPKTIEEYVPPTVKIIALKMYLDNLREVTNGILTPEVDLYNELVKKAKEELHDIVRNPGKATPVLDMIKVVPATITTPPTLSVNVEVQKLSEEFKSEMNKMRAEFTKMVDELKNKPQ